jgi:phage protein|nr:MAG TPA: Protein of unknown function (DUF2634) [Caudoviricetes sp.]
MSVLKTYETQRSFYPSKTYRIRDGHLEGTIDGLDAVGQAVDLILTTERFVYPVYSADYGVEFAELIGKDRAYVEGDIQRRITEALEQDDRIIQIEYLGLTFARDQANVMLLVKTKFGDLLLERGVPLG